MKVSIISFSFKRILPKDPIGSGGGFVSDSRAKPNPFWGETQHGHIGCVKPGCDFLARIIGIGGIPLVNLGVAKASTDESKAAGASPAVAETVAEGASA